MTATVRVVVVDYNGGEILPRCLESLATSVHASVPLTVIDNNSTPPSQSLVPDHLKNRIEIIRNKTNTGYAGAIHKAWSTGKEDYLAIVNNDLSFEPGWLKSLVEFAEKHNAHAVRAVISHENDSGLEMSTNASLNPLLYLIHGIFNDRTRAVYPSGACFLLKRDPNLPITPVDPDYFLYYEDVYIGFLLRSLGKTVIQCPDSVVQHIGSHSVSTSDPKKIAFLQEYNRITTQLLFFDFATLAGIFPLVFIDFLLKIPACWIRRKPALATLSAGFAVLFGIRKILNKRKRLRHLPGFDSRRILPYLTGKVLTPGSVIRSVLNSLTTGWCRIVGIPVDREAGK